MSQLGVLTVLLLWAVADTASWWAQSRLSSCSERLTVGRGHKTGLQPQESRRGSCGEVLPPCPELPGRVLPLLSLSVLWWRLLPCPSAVVLHRAVPMAE